jgi:metal-responsive CopG/Arc/MetJ family transcriptional regulator
MMIQPKHKPTLETVTITMPEDVLAALDHYCQFLGGATDRSYVITAAVRHVMARDRRYKGGDPSTRLTTRTKRAQATSSRSRTANAAQASEKQLGLSDVNASPRGEHQS